MWYANELRQTQIASGHWEISSPPSSSTFLTHPESYWMSSYQAWRIVIPASEWRQLKFWLVQSLVTTPWYTSLSSSATVAFIALRQEENFTCSCFLPTLTDYEPGICIPHWKELNPKLWSALLCQGFSSTKSWLILKFKISFLTSLHPTTHQVDYFRSVLAISETLTRDRNEFDQHVATFIVWALSQQNRHLRVGVMKALPHFLPHLSSQQHAVVHQQVINEYRPTLMTCI